MDYAELTLGSHIAWFEVLARIGRSSQRVPGALAVRTGVRSNTDNGIAVDPDSVDFDGLESVIHWLRDSDVPASCVLTKAADAATLQRLISFGLTADNAGHEMGRSLNGYRPPPATALGYEIVEVTTSVDLMNGLAALGDDWYDDIDRHHRHRLALDIGVGPGSPVRHWVARRQSASIAMATSFLFDDVVVLLQCGVNPTHRRRGVAAALTDTRLTAAIADGAITAVLSPSPDGYELHRTLGFDLVRSYPDRWFHIS